MFFNADVRADEKMSKPATQPAAAASDDMMAKMMELGTPGPQHQLLEKMAGHFTVKSAFRMSPDSPWQESTGEEKGEMILGGRYLKADFNGDMMGKPFKGVGLTGYDNYAKKFNSVWVDSMSTMMMVSEGTASADGKTLTFGSECDCPITGEKKQMRQVWTITDDDHHGFVMYDKTPDGKEFESLKIEYTRVK
ncbi:MAG: DUF1579 domain-containing protein [Tepidisphaeraceae bacterium]